MEQLFLVQPVPQPIAAIRPHLDSLDSSPEFSLEHMLELVTLVEEEEFDLDGYVFDDSCLFVSQ